MSTHVHIPSEEPEEAPSRLMGSAQDDLRSRQESPFIRRRFAILAFLLGTGTAVWMLNLFATIAILSTPL